MSIATAFKAPPSRVRYGVLALTTMVAVLLYLDRICLSYFSRYVREDLGMTRTEMGLVLSSFFWTYAIGQLPAGWLSDRFGARLMLALYLAIWSLFTGLLGFAYAMGTMLLLRLGCGLFEAGAYPAAAGVIGNWIPFQRRGLASGIVSVGGRLGGAAAPLLSAALMVAFVPVSTLSLLSPRDILSARTLFPNLTYSPLDDRPPPGVALAQEFYGRLPKTVQSEISAGTALSDQDVALLAESINDCLRSPHFLDDIDLAPLNVPAEATRLLKTPAASLSAEELQRRNRLVLEVAFPESIRRVYGAGLAPRDDGLWNRGNCRGRDFLHVFSQ